MSSPYRTKSEIDKKLNALSVSTRRRKIKLLCIEYKGGKCEICGYNKCPASLTFHHQNPAEKEFGIASSGTTKSFEAYKSELDKCILVCANCHAEIHFNEDSERMEIKLNELKTLKRLKKVGKTK